MHLKAHLQACASYITLLSIISNALKKQIISFNLDNEELNSDLKKIFLLQLR